MQTHIKQWLIQQITQGTQNHNMLLSIEQANKDNNRCVQEHDDTMRMGYWNIAKKLVPRNLNIRRTAVTYSIEF